MQCSAPVRLVDESGQEFYVPCGRCYECLQNRSSQWIQRLLLEREAWQNTYFFTLTYDDVHLPRNKDGRGTVAKQDVKTFIAGLRQRFQQGFFHFMDRKFSLPPCRFRYYITSEYGSEIYTFRPHYHGVLFIECADLDLLFLLFSSVWRRGMVDFQAAGDKAAGYVSKYLVKYSLEDISMFIEDEYGEKIFSPIERPFTLMSKGIGADYLTPAKIDWHRQSPVERGYMPKPGGKRAPLPRYFREKIFDEDMKAARLDSYLNQSPLQAWKYMSKEEFQHHLNLEERIHKERVRQAKKHYQLKKVL